jgi:TRAP-type uncharacterized transport system substrate-binding protein
MEQNKELVVLLDKVINDVENIKEKIKTGDQSGAKTELVKLLADMLGDELKGKKESEMTPGERAMNNMAKVAKSYADIAMIESLNLIEKSSIDELRKR